MISEEKRQAELHRAERTAKTDGGKPTYRVEVKGSPRDLPVFRVPTSWPKYRLENGRTIQNQQAKIHQNPEIAEVLQDKSSADAQAIQEEILLQMVEKEGLIDLLDAEGQRDPLILSFEGYVVNGNRRLAAMRRLQRTGRGNKDFDYVDVVMLPELAESEISAIEMRLQMAKEGKARYNWLDELLVIEKNQRDNEMSFDEIRVAMRTTRKALETKLRMLNLVREYLDAQGTPNQFFHVGQDEQAFKTLSDLMKRYESSSSVRQRIKQESFSFIAHKQPGSSVHKKLLQNADRIKLEVATTDVPNSSKNDENPLSALLKESQESTPTPKIMSQDETAEIDKELEDKQRQEDEEKRLQAPLRDAVQAKALVESLPTESSHPYSSQVENHLRSLIRIASDKLAQIVDD